jgi:hypothetical protein
VGAAEANDPLGWIIARYEDRQYVEGNDPCLNLVPSPKRLTFPYDRQAAANYAIEHSYQNDGLADPLIGQRVSRRLVNNQSGIAIPFADFYYSYLSGSEGRTGSAVFVSEAIWAGGLPMTVGSPDSCSNAQQFTESGWRYCDLNQGGSNSWDFHQAIISYYTVDQAPSENIINNILVEMGFPNNKGTRINFPGRPMTELTDAIWGGRELPFSDDRSDLFLFIPSLEDGRVEDINGLGVFVATHLSTVKMGDYAWIDPLSQSTHGLIVVGWGPIEDCSLSHSTRRRIQDFQVAYDASMPNLVPYVADFTRVQSPTSRPFYCTRYFEVNQANFTRHNWRFYRLSDQITLSLSKIYVDDQWTWTFNDGVLNP